MLRLGEWRKRGLGREWLSEHREERVRLEMMKRKKDGTLELPWTWRWERRELQREVDVHTM